VRSFIVQKNDASGLLTLSPILKCTTTMHMLAYNIAVEATNEYCRRKESKAMEILEHFVGINCERLF
jgi:hypothetical protein